MPLTTWPLKEFLTESKLNGFILFYFTVAFGLRNFYREVR